MLSMPVIILVLSIGIELVQLDRTVIWQCRIRVAHRRRCEIGIRHRATPPMWCHVPRRASMPIRKDVTRVYWTCWLSIEIILLFVSWLSEHWKSWLSYRRLFSIVADKNIMPCKWWWTLSPICWSVPSAFRHIIKKKTNQFFHYVN